MGNLIGKVGKVYMGWEILDIELGIKNGRNYKVRCKCGLEKKFKHKDFNRQSSEFGCRTCIFKSKRILRKGNIVGNYEVMDEGQQLVGQFKYKFKCLECNIETYASVNKLTKSGCRNCISSKAHHSKIIIGNLYGFWKVLNFSHISKKGAHYFLCECKCGFLLNIMADRLIRELTKSCRACSPSGKPSILIDIGEKFTNWTVVDNVSKRLSKSGHRMLLCKCDCGKMKEVGVPQLIRGDSSRCRSCATVIINRSKKNIALKNIIIGDKFGKWTIIGEGQPSKTGQTYFLCKCDCGKVLSKRDSSLLNGTAIHCLSCAMLDTWNRRKGIYEQPKPLKLTEYNNPYLNFCIIPRTMDDIIEHFGLKLEEIQDALMDLMLNEKIEQNRELLWETI